MRRSLVWVVSLGLASCSGRPERGRPTDAEMRARFFGEQATLEKLRGYLLTDTDLSEVRTNSYSWTEPCEWPGGCVRWEDRPPTPAIVARLGHVSAARAAEYLRGLQRIGAVAVRRDSPDRVVFWMHVAGIIPSGSIKSIVWQRTLPAVLVADTDSAVTRPHGEVASRIEGDWYIEFVWN